MRIDWDKVPEWVNWIAMDANGLWCGYSQKPYMDMDALIWSEADTGSSWICLHGRPYAIEGLKIALTHDWTRSLHRRLSA